MAEREIVDGKIRAKKEVTKEEEVAEDANNATESAAEKNDTELKTADENDDLNTEELNTEEEKNKTNDEEV